MYGDELQKAINVINDYLQSGNSIGLWDLQDPIKPTLNLDKNSKLDFVVWKFGKWNKEE